MNVQCKHGRMWIGRRSYGDTRENYLEAIFGNQQNLLRLEWAAGRDVTF